MGQPTSSDVLRSFDLAREPDPAQWTCEAVEATFLRRGELVPPAEWSLMRGATVREMEVAGELVAASRARATRKAYGRHVRSWLTWAGANEACPLPADPSAVQHFLVERAIDLAKSKREDSTGEVELKGRLVMNSVSQIMAALSRLHTLAEFPAPSQHPRVQELMSGLRRTLDQTPRGAKAALTWDLLNEVLDAQRHGPMTASQLRAGAAQELNAETGASAGQLARLLRSDVTVEGDAVVLALAPTRRGGTRTRHMIEAKSTAGVLLARWLRTSQTWPGTAVFRDQQGKALTRQGLHKILSRDRVEAQMKDEPVVSPADVRDRALLLAGWMSALRRSNLSALTWNNLTRSKSGWTFYMVRSKTDQEGRGGTVHIPFAPEGSGIADPAAAIDDWLELVTLTLGTDPRRLENVPVFVRIDRYGRMRLVDGRPVGISGAAISEIVKRRVRASGLEDRPHQTRAGLWSEVGRAFAAHSLRAGFVTEGFERELKPTEIMAVTGHGSLRTLQDYYRPASSPDVLAATSLMAALGDGSRSEGVRALAPRRPRGGPDWSAPLGVRPSLTVAHDQ